MARAGGGSRSGGRSSGGRSGGSRSSGGHRVSSGSSSRRAGSSSFGGSGRSSFGGGEFSYRGGYNPPPPPPPRRTYGYGGYSRGPVHHTTVYHSGSRSSGCLTSVLAMIIILVVIFAMFGGISGGSYGIPKSAINREKVNTGVVFQNDCIIDELGWFDNVSSASRDLQYFYNKTGIQPYIYLKDYDPSLATDEAKDAYGTQYIGDGTYNTSKTAIEEAKKNSSVSNKEETDTKEHR